MYLVVFGAQTTKMKTNTIPTLWRLCTCSLGDKNSSLHRSNILIYCHLGKYTYYTKLGLGKVINVNKFSECYFFIKILALIFKNILFPPLWITIYYFTAFINNSSLSTTHLLIPPLSILIAAIYQGTCLPCFEPGLTHFIPLSSLHSMWMLITLTTLLPWRSLNLVSINAFVSTLPSRSRDTNSS